MPIGKESDFHRVMVEAFELRLRKLFPDGKITLGQKIHPVGLKPDIFIRHPDGRQWAYEMIKGNQNRDHLAKNHERYKEHGIHDFWILWDELAPGKVLPDLNQGVIAAFRDIPRQAKLNSLYKTILAAHADHRATKNSFLYAFSLNILGENSESAHKILKSLSIGVSIFEFDDFEQEKSDYRKNSLSLAEIAFDEDGFIIPGNLDTLDESLYDGFFQQKGIDFQKTFVPAAVISEFNTVANEPQEQKDLMMSVLKKIFERLTPEELTELGEFAKSGKSKIPAKFTLDDPSIVGEISLSDSDGIKNLSAIMQNISGQINEQDWPDSLKKIIGFFLETGGMDSIAEVMKWQETSDAIVQINKEKK